jgi:peptidoglycan/xylan/chitin deacetylase (PgdA/CDA1 family)
MEPLPPGFRWPDGMRAAAMFGFDLDAEAVMLADHPEVADYLDVIAHQRYGPRVAVPRLLRMLDRVGLRTTFFVPGWVAETWPEVARSVRDAGHEIGHHGYLHESVRGVDEAIEEGYLLRGLEALDTVLGVRPIGYRAPSWDMNFRTPALLAKHGFRYDSGLMDSDHPYRLAAGEATGSAAPAGPDSPTLVELPVHWSLDDWNRWNYVPGYAASPILRPSDVEAAWAEELDAIVEVGGLFNLTMHPFVSGRPARAAAIERLIERARAIDGLWIAAGDEIAAWVETLDLPPVWHEPPAVPDQR